MKKLLTVLLITLFSTTVKSQESDLPKMIGDTIFTTSGFKIIKNQMIKVGIGSMPDGDFKYIRINSSSLFAYSSNKGYKGLANQANSFPRSESGLNYKIREVEQRGNKKRGYVYYAKIGRGLINYEIDIENAIKSAEIDIPEEFRPKSKVVQINQQISVADELVKLKKLYDDGILTKEEFEGEKKKLLEKN